MIIPMLLRKIIKYQNYQTLQISLNIVKLLFLMN